MYECFLLKIKKYHQTVKIYIRFNFFQFNIYKI